MIEAVKSTVVSGSPHILIVSGVGGDTRRYRTFHSHQQLSLAGCHCQVTHITHSSLPAQVAQADVLILHRTPFDQYIQKLLKASRNRGSLILVDVDDLTFDPNAFQWISSPDFVDPIRKQIYQGDMLRQRATIEASDGVIASTEYLADQIRKIGKPAWVHRNGYSQEMFRLSENAKHKRQRDSSRVVIGYASGTPTHDQDFAIVRQALIDILTEHENVSLHLVGPLDPGMGFEYFGERVKRLPFVPWRNLPQVLSQFDINLAPLVLDNPFSQSKSEIKYLEAAMVGVPTIASPTDAFSFAITHAENGMLAETTEEWRENFSRLIRDLALRTRIGENAYRRAVTEYSLEKRAEQLLNTLNGIAFEVKGEILFHSYPHATHNVDDIPIEWETSPSYFQRGLYSLRNRGIRTLLGEIWIYFRRMISPIFPFRK